MRDITTDVDSSSPAHRRLRERHGLAGTRTFLLEDHSVADMHPALTRVVRAPEAAP